MHRNGLFSFYIIFKLRCRNGLSGRKRTSLRKRHRKINIVHGFKAGAINHELGYDVVFGDSQAHGRVKPSLLIILISTKPAEPKEMLILLPMIS